MDRRSFVSMAVAGTVAMAAGIGRSQDTSAGDSQIKYPEDQQNLKARWEKLDRTIRGWWDGDLHRATEKEIREDPKGTLLYLPFPYIAGGGSESAFPEIYGWDTQFTNLALIDHGRLDIMRWNMLDQLSQIERFGKVLNGNRSFYITRGQPPLLAWSVQNYLAVKNDDDELAMLAYPLLERAYVHYWNGPLHATPTGLSTCRDGGDKGMPPELASECESGLDYTPIFGGKITECVPIHVNCALVRQAQVLAMLADRFGWKDKAARWKKEASDRANRINQYCWDDAKGAYMEYNYVRKTQLPYYSLNTFWPLWAGIASKTQAKRVVDNIGLFDRPFGMTFTDKTYPNPHPEFTALEWAYPEAWPPQQIIVAMALQRYGNQKQARDVSRRYIGNMVTTWEKTGLLWERYNALDGGHLVPLERHEPRPLHGFTSASAVVVGRVAFS
ncbi:MAG: trehalase family glycosidase [Acidobacteriaceae bacterium]